METIKLGKHAIGPGHPCFIIAEAGVNHNGSLELALELVRKAKECGVDCVKFQTFKAESVVTKAAPKAAYQLEVTDHAESQLDMLKKLELSLDDYRAIIALCQELDIVFLSTPYNEGDADFLFDLGVPGFKIASGQLVEHRFVQYVAAKGLPVIMSTGMGNLAEVCESVAAFRATGNEQLSVLQCTTNYPAAIEDANLRAMNTIKTATQTIVGYSDHVPNNYACYAAVARGAHVIEKHFTLDRNMEGPDHSSSLDPAQFAELVVGIRATEMALGNGLKVPSAAEVRNTEGMRRSIVLGKALTAGSKITSEDIVFKRPATGIAPKRLNEVIGKQLKTDLPADHILQMSDLAW